MASANTDGKQNVFKEEDNNCYELEAGATRNQNQASEFGKGTPEPQDYPNYEAPPSYDESRQGGWQYNEQQTGWGAPEPQAGLESFPPQSGLEDFPPQARWESIQPQAGSELPGRSYGRGAGGIQAGWRANQPQATRSSASPQQSYQDYILEKYSPGQFLTSTSDPPVPRQQPQANDFTMPQRGQYCYDQTHVNNTTVVVSQPMPNYAYVEPPADQMGPAVFVCLCCCWIFGILAIIKASNANDAKARGNNLEAQRQAASAKTYIRISLVLGIIAYIISIVSFVLRIVGT